MAQKYNKSLYSNKLTDSEYNRILGILKKSKSNLIESNEILDRFTINKINVSLYKTKRIVVQGNNIVNVCIKLNLPYVKYYDKKQPTVIYKESTYIGCDEVGVGDYFGGIICCAVYVDPNTTERLKDLHVDDSKKISDDKILILGPKIKKICQNMICVIPPNKFNSLYDKYHNTHVIKTFGHNDCITQLKAKIGMNTPVYMDQYCTKDNYLKYLNKLNINYSNRNSIDVFETKSESKYIAIAAASIIARYEFINMINKLEKKLHKYKGLEEISIPYGATNKYKIFKIIDMITNTLGEDKLGYFIKLCFNR